ncbi:hypothetical protein RRG08_025253 [Elysia crispata]|uniref:Uncharacterized protein n=1 Tax=Elysia crispata TaxID=231223 RepID=A0AAE1AAQ3_9GAST|nr:hypothetical protein RRG08_025253 [Elysia crispata]
MSSEANLEIDLSSCSSALQYYDSTPRRNLIARWKTQNKKRIEICNSYRRLSYDLHIKHREPGASSNGKRPNAVEKSRSKHSGRPILGCGTNISANKVKEIPENDLRICQWSVPKDPQRTFGAIPLNYRPTIWTPSLDEPSRAEEASTQYFQILYNMQLQNISINPCESLFGGPESWRSRNGQLPNPRGPLFDTQIQTLADLQS